MSRPALPARVKDADHGAGDRIDAREIWAFVPVIVVTRQGKVFRITTAAVLLGDNVLDL